MDGLFIATVFRGGSDCERYEELADAQQRCRRSRLSGRRSPRPWAHKGSPGGRHRPGRQRCAPCADEIGNWRSPPVPLAGADSNPLSQFKLSPAWALVNRREVKGECTHRAQRWRRVVESHHLGPNSRGRPNSAPGIALGNCPIFRQYLNGRRKPITPNGKCGTQCDSLLLTDDTICTHFPTIQIRQVTPKPSPEIRACGRSRQRLFWFDYWRPR